MNYESEILKLKKEKNAIILAHNYTRPEIQKIADYLGDSLELSRISANNDAAMIVFCGVHFMAESAYMLAPTKTVLIPDENAGCPMADMATPEKIMEMRKKYPEAAVVTYINSSAATKAVSDYCCTSANAVKLVQAIPEQQVIFCPDKNLGSYVKKHTSKDVILWDGYCPVHNAFTLDKLNKIKAQYPAAKIITHPECPNEIVENSDIIGSTSEMLNFANSKIAEDFIIATENGMISRFQREVPGKNFIEADADFICEDMKKITLEKLYLALKNEQYKVTVPEKIRVKGVRCLDKMLEYSK